MASIHRIETGEGTRWKVRWRNRGEPKNHSTSCKTHEGAKKVKLAAELAHDTGVPYYGPEAEAEALVARRVDLRAAAREYLASRRRAGKSAGTIYQTDIALTLFFDVIYTGDAEDLDGNPLPIWSTNERGEQRLSVAALGAYYDHLRNVRGNSLETCRGHVGYVQRWWDWLCGEGGYEDRLPRPKTIEMAEPPAKDEPVAPTWEEMDRAVACAGGWYQQLFATCRFTGLRGEDQALLMRRDDFDHAAGLMRVRPELGKTRQERRGRTVPVSPYFLEMIRGWPVDPDGWLIHIPRTSNRWKGTPKRRAWNDQISGIWMRAGVRSEVWDTGDTTDGHRKNGRPMHAFRRGIITNLQAAGVKQDDVKYLVGHQLPGGVTTERYTDQSGIRLLREAVALIPPIQPVEVRAVQGGAVVWAGLPEGGRYARPG